MGTVGEGCSFRGRQGSATDPLLGNLLRLGSDSCAPALAQPSGTEFPFPVLTLSALPKGWPAAGRHQPGPREGAPQRVFLDEGEGTAREQWASVAAGRQALPVNPFLEVQLWGAPQSLACLGGVVRWGLTKQANTQDIFCARCCLQK